MNSIFRGITTTYDNIFFNANLKTKYAYNTTVWLYIRNIHDIVCSSNCFYGSLVLKFTHSVHRYVRAYKVFIKWCQPVSKLDTNCASFKCTFIFFVFVFWLVWNQEILKKHRYKYLNQCKYESTFRILKWIYFYCIKIRFFFFFSLSFFFFFFFHRIVNVCGAAIIK